MYICLFFDGALFEADEDCFLKVFDSTSLVTPYSLLFFGLMSTFVYGFITAIHVAV